jgi:hypothetical protein
MWQFFLFKSEWERLNPRPVTPSAPRADCLADIMDSLKRLIKIINPTRALATARVACTSATQRETTGTGSQAALAVETVCLVKDNVAALLSAGASLTPHNLHALKWNNVNPTKSLDADSAPEDLIHARMQICGGLLRDERLHDVIDSNNDDGDDSRSEDCAGASTASVLALVGPSWSSATVRALQSAHVSCAAITQLVCVWEEEAEATCRADGHALAVSRDAADDDGGAHWQRRGVRIPQAVNGITLLAMAAQEQLAGEWACADSRTEHTSSFREQRMLCRKIGFAGFRDRFVLHDYIYIVQV